MEKYDPDTKKQVGRGAFGSVYLYQRKNDHREIIIKQITIDDLTTDQRKGVMNEIDLTRRFNHPNIVKYHDYFVEDKTFNIVMEYCPGGNLYDYLQKRHEEGRILEEEEILKFFGQIARAMHHIHDSNILHRDMKTHNILLDQRKKVVKICDFGISKLLTKTNAYSVVGTAHYMSPEVVEGKLYNKKSDIWSLGCILYELITLKRAFEGESLSTILQRILRCSFTKMPDFYSEELKDLVKSILVIDPSKRPDLNQILAAPVLINSLLDLETDVGRIPCLYAYGRTKALLSHSDRGQSIISTDSSVHRTISFTSWADEASQRAAEQTSVVYFWGAGVKAPTVLTGPSSDPMIKQVCCGRTKKLGLTTNGRVFTWESSFSTTTRPKDDVESMATQSVMVPKIIGEKLSGSTIEEISCGDHFVAVKTDRGMLMTWGTGEDGCLGHGSLQDTSKARVVETLVGYTITQISCGAAHVLALTYDGQVYAWGRGNSGNLGFNDTKNRLKPTLVRLPSSSIKPKYVVCGPNYSFILASDGSVYACGNNSDNKLALLTDQDLDSDQTSQKDYLIFTKVTCEPLRSYKTKSIAAGPLHTAFITETGMLFTAGSNRNSQLGYPRPEGDYRPALVESVSQSGVKDVGCGDTYTIAVTMNNKLYSWGSGRSGRLGLGRMEHTLHPNEISTNGAKFNYQSLSVCHNATLVIGQVNSAS